MAPYSRKLKCLIVSNFTYFKDLGDTLISKVLATQALGPE